MIRTKLKGYCPKRTEPAHSHKNKSIPAWKERHLMTLSPPRPAQDPPASTQVTVMPDAWAHLLSRCISPCIQNSRHLHTLWHHCIYCVCTALSKLVLCNIPNSLMTAVPLRWHILCSRVTTLGGAALRSYMARLQFAAGVRGGISQLWITCKRRAKERMLNGLMQQPCYWFFIVTC